MISISSYRPKQKKGTVLTIFRKAVVLGENEKNKVQFDTDFFSSSGTGN